MMILRFFMLVVLMNLAHYTTFSQSTKRVYLSGKGFDDAVEWKFMCTDGRKSGEWTTIPVPSCWELQGFGTYNYGHARESDRGKESGMYELNFPVPEEWKGQQVEIYFEGVMTDAEVKINNRSAGSKHQGAFYRFKHDISRLLKYGEDNLLEVKVDKHSSDESVNNAERRADYWIFGGIFRPVYLEIKPKENIERIAVDPRADGTLTAEVYINNNKKSSYIETQLFDINRRPVSETEKFSIEDNREKVLVNTGFDDIVAWNPEDPVLYIIEFRLMADDEPLHIMEERIGFRTVDIRERDGIYINDVKVRLKGVNRHSFWPETGRTLNRELSIRDVQLMKDMNMNAVRMSHYPPDEHFLDVCDSLGLFVLDELAGWQASYDTGPGEKLVREMVIRDHNHPSIIIWDNGNEGGWNTELDDDFTKYDIQNRIVIHPWENFRKTNTNHYIDYNYGTHDGFNGTEIFFPTEFLHGLYDGGHGAGLEDFWNLMLSRPRAAGGFLWVFSDEAVVRTDKNGELDSDGNHAPDGIVGPYREKEGSFFTIKEIWAPVYFKDILITDNFDGVFEIENRYHFTNLSQCSFFYDLVQFPGPEESKDGNISLKYGQLKSPVISPGEKGLLKIDLPENWNEADALYIQAFDPTGREIFTWDWAISLPGEYSSGKISFKSELPAPEFNETDNTIEITGNDIAIVIEKESGILKSVYKGDKKISFSGGPVLAEGESEFKEYTLHQAEDSFVYEAEFNGNQKHIRWQMFSNGLLKLNYVYYPNNHQPYYGINFNYPEEQVTGIKWLGKGPYRVWKNRLKGTRLNVWEKEYNNTITGETYDYPEFKGYHAKLYWMELFNNEQDFKIYTSTENLYLRLYTPGVPEAEPRYTKAEFPEGNISFLNAISPMGTKFKSPESLGPQSQQNMYRRHRTDGNIEIELIFDFR